ncbi:MAG TPA: lipopolysaccharide kinase InaA family protein [Longimicrobiales bacterium]|nr:lipopolysaccharide kinase InaA family protein [Longimicrobiales bacterium]
MTDLPAGYRPVTGPGAWAFAVPELTVWVEATVRDTTLHEWAEDRARSTLAGRGPVHVAEVAGEDRAVRHYFRGGAVAVVLGDRYLRLGVPRPVRELRASVAARERGVPTPRVVAGAVYPTGLFYRADLVTDYVADSRDLAAVLFGDEDDDTRRTALVATGELVGRMAAAGLRHPDLNARNVLLTPSDGGLRALLLDLDRCSVEPARRPTPALAMLARLRRSLAKLAAARGAVGPSREELELLEATAVSAGGRA